MPPRNHQNSGPTTADTPCRYEGSLSLIVGSMFSGKSTELLHRINSFLSIGKQILVINHTFNVRSDEEGKQGITTHDCLQHHSIGYTSSHTDCITLTTLADLFTTPAYASLVEHASVICIEELQFFTDTKESVLQLINEHSKKVIAAGLIADYEGNLFGDVGALIPYADDVHHSKALCSVCNDGTPGIFTQRISPHCDQIAVGEKDMYRAVCRKHYYS
jgi:thymidine kinase